MLFQHCSDCAAWFPNMLFDSLPTFSSFGLALYSFSMWLVRPPCQLLIFSNDNYNTIFNALNFARQYDKNVLRLIVNCCVFTSFCVKEDVSRHPYGHFLSVSVHTKIRQKKPLPYSHRTAISYSNPWCFKESKVSARKVFFIQKTTATKV